MEWKKCHDVVEVKTHSLGATTLLYSCIHVRVLMGTWCVWWGCGSVTWLAHSVASGTWELLLPTPWWLPQKLHLILFNAIKHKLKRNISCHSKGTGTQRTLTRNDIWEYFTACEVDATSQILNISTKLSLHDNQQKGITEAFWKQYELLFPSWQPSWLRKACGLPVTSECALRKFSGFSVVIQK